MYFNKPILHDPTPKFSPALEETIKIDLQDKSYILRNKYYPYVASFLPKTEMILFKHISQYRDTNITILSSPYPTKYPYWNPATDETVIFKCTNIDKLELRKDILSVKLPEGVEQKKNFQPFPTAMILIMRYYMLTNQQEKLKVIYSYMAYSMYWSVFNKQFSKYMPREDVMIYTINNLSNKFKLKQFSSVDELLFYIINTTMEKYKDRLIGNNPLSDSDIWYIIDQIKTRLSNSFKKITNEYMINNKNKEIMYKSEDILDDEGTQRIDSSISASVESLANAYTTEFFSGSPDTSRINMSAKLAGVSSAELRSTLYSIKQDESINEVKLFYESLFYIYLTSGDSNANIDTIKSAKFLSVMRSIFKKGNSTDKNIVITRDLMNDWLQRGSNTYRATRRQATMNDYRLAVYYYFILSVTSNK
jgi:hypothetical protein